MPMARPKGTERPDDGPEEPSDRHSQQNQRRQDDDDANQDQSGITKYGMVQSVVRQCLRDGGFHPVSRPAADGASERNAGSGELADGVVGRPAGVVDEPVGVGQEESEYSGGREFLLVGQ